MKRVLQALADSLEAQSGSMTAALCDALRRSKGDTHLPPCEPPPAGRMLDQILATGNPDPHPLLAEVARSRETLAWYGARPERIPEAIGARLFFVELLGPDGMVFCDRCRLGLLLQMPESHYPEHAHAADELYLVLSGTAEWRSEGSEPALRPPGSFIHHPGRQRHAMTTQEEALLAVWAWTGDIGFESYSIEAGP
ncbi:dimethylsulfonioproprionate lyase family protein [Denitrobaculum tricleocarpae]|uniref:Cupin domain-containing protein n=1 Tax=Denitrobaculum tricleocarpae TaxID=2591009 RepID=A0A545TEW5_9PROT|nr:dimethylsulfonioproprionate lyase family protein [Denitrobaculum tricleocarpae]TQV75716.1 cupin domain-containing protein [Denitrobaculum tricleocarpae]